MSTVKRAEEGMQKIGTIGKESLYFDAASKAYAVQRTDQPTGEPQPIDQRQAEAFLNKLGLKPSQLVTCNLRLLGEATAVVANAKNFIAGLPSDRVPSDVDRAIVADHAEEAGLIFGQACGEAPKGPFAEKIASLDASLDVLAYANESTVNSPVARKDDPTGQKKN